MTPNADTLTDRVKIFDTTLRDGEQSPGATMSHEEKLEIAALLDAHVAGIEKLLKSATGPAGKPVADHLAREVASIAALRKEKGW